MKYSLSFRVWHWLNALVILGLVGTVLLRWTFLSKTDNAEILANKLLSMGITITHEQAITLAKSLRVELWEWHIILGFIFAALLLLRAILEKLDARNVAPFKELDLHHKIVQISYCVLYIVLTTLAVTGLLLYFSKELSIAKEIVHNIKELHELVYYYVAFFIPVHIAGVFFADATKEKGLVSDMINGGVKEKN
ncbi:MAG: cytochrome b/b6 domain-containing protein [Campylobacterales bacterium]|nr:cytochrome b/b6 domain-containing protein [Campylobacterales bacterium]